MLVSIGGKLNGNSDAATVSRSVSWLCLDVPIHAPVPVPDRHLDRSGYPSVPVVRFRRIRGNVTATKKSIEAAVHGREAVATVREMKPWTHCVVWRF
ncbi:hypothetical protein [Allorhodopirellula solitaria]|uniref:Uncharacterized protein n=1 Tax=Allorhodopirellula solitaria TaxID=2527987 RepID=A0A5C5YJE9_9BACT|nr:hypothetical protein [Allorhodopirellula solitaria]TWT75005.1 hypothetical protein CA85_02930 [Allorhodopirellula solitaria]